MFFNQKKFNYEHNTAIVVTDPINLAVEQKNIHSFKIKEVYNFLGQNIRNKGYFVQYAVNHKKQKSFALKSKIRIAQKDIEVFLDREYNEWLFCFNEAPTELRLPSGVVIKPHVLDLSRGMDIIPWCTYYKLF